MKDKKYSVTLVAFIYAPTDKSARKQAKKLAKVLRKIDDNWAEPTKLDEMLPNSIYSREVKL